MANRLCPLCFVKIPRAAVLAHSNDVVCPSCHSPLELSRHSRVVAALLGVVASYLVAQFVAVADPLSAWFLTVVATVLTYGVISAVFLFFVSDLAIRPKLAEAPFPQHHG